MQHESTSTDSQGSSTNSIADEVQASAQIVDQGEEIKPSWEVGWIPLSLQDERLKRKS